MTIKELLDILDEASDIRIYYNDTSKIFDKTIVYEGNLEDMDFRASLTPLLDKTILRAMPTKHSLLVEKNDDPYLEIEVYNT